jgi:hypothetical protein
MKYYTSTTEYNCGIELHAHQRYVCAMDRQGKKLVHCNIQDNAFDYFLKLIKPYRHSLTLCSECMFGWYWLADACADEVCVGPSEHPGRLGLGAGRPRAVQACPGLHTGPIESE